MTVGPFVSPAAAEEADALLRKASEAYGKRDWTKTVDLATQALKADPKLADAFNLRGAALFMRGKFKESVADFDRYLKLAPNKAAGHWQRGISLYYAKDYDKGRKQFEGYEKEDTNDVENAVWHFLCVARKDGVKKARTKILKIGKDPRVPMMEVYDLFKGSIKPADVLKAAEAGDVAAALRKRQLFYAHLYLGLYYDATGDAKKALEHMALADEKYRIGHYMGDVARVHHELLKKAPKPK
jgi:lipoprotein NlpI